MATFTCFSAPPNRWAFNFPGDPFGPTYDAAASNSGLLVFNNGDGTRTFIRGTGLSFLSGGIGWTTLTSIEHISSTGAILQQITGMSGITSGQSPQGLLPHVLAGVDTITGSSGNDSVRGGNASDTFLMGAGLDEAIGEGGNDLFRIQAGDWIYGANGFVGEDVGGGSGTDRVRLEAVGTITIGAQLNSVEELEFSGGAATTATLDGLDLRPGSSGLTTFIGGAGADHLVFKANGTSDYSQLVFSSWTAGQDTITIYGGLGANFITGTANNDTVILLQGTGNNYGVDMGAGDDTLVVPLDSLRFNIFGGTGTDTLRLDNATVDLYDPSAVTVSGLERLVFNTGTSSITFNSESVAADFLTTVVGSSQLDILKFWIRFDGTLDLSALTFQSWSANDVVEIFETFGNGVASSIVGTSQADIITVRQGSDTVAGGAGNDTYNVLGPSTTIIESSTGGASDRINAAVSYTLGANAYVETLATTDAAATDAIDLTGNTFGQSIIGNAGNNSLSGGGGGDLIDGKGGLDTIVETAAGPYSLIKTAQTANAWTISAAGLTDQVTNVERATLNGTTTTLRQAASNFNFGATNDTGATSDILLAGGGNFINWTVQSNAVVTGSVLTSGLVGWTAVALGDANADGDADIFLQNGGTVVTWSMQSGSVASGSVITNGALGWTVEASGDIDNDGDFDLILQNGGTVVAWRMQDGVYQSGAVLTSGAAGWQVVGTGDFWGDGSSDVLLQNGGTVVAWNLVNGNYAAGTVLTSGAAGWTVKGTGDLNADGTTDIVLQNGATVVDWLVTGGSVTTGNVIGSAAGFDVAAIGDYNGDGTSDILLQGGNSVVAWRLNNGLYASGHFIGNAAGYGVVG